METYKSKAYGASGSLIGGKTLKLMDVERPNPNESEVQIDVLYCGVCHSDVHQVANDWSNTIYPCVPGHEVIGRIIKKGNAVTRFQVNDIVGVGCMINSCQQCSACKEGVEQFCEGPVGQTMTYNGYWKPDGSGFNTFGGYSDSIVVNEAFLIRIPENLDVAKVAPILCAGVTTFSPLNKYAIKHGDKVGVVGIGGLGHMAVQLAKAMGAQVTAITTSEEKRQAALELGANNVLISTDKEAMMEYEAYFNFILITIPEAFDVNPYVNLLHRNGSLVTVGLLGPYDKPVNNMQVAMQNRSVGGSMIGGVAETQQVMDFCAEHNILPEVEIIAIKDINEAFDKIKDQDVRFRYVIDMKTLAEA